MIHASTLFGLFALAAFAGGTPPLAQEPVADQAATPVAESVALGHGRLVPLEADAIRPWPQAYSGSLTLLEVLPHGSWVEEGQPVARLDRRSLDKQLRDARSALERAEMDREATAMRAGMREESTDWSLERKRLAVEQAERELAGWNDFEHQHREAQQRLSRLYREHGLEDALDELEQLEAMYTDDELTDATEEIVLKRSRRNLERSRFSAELQEAQANYTARTDWRRVGQSREVALREAKLSLEHARHEAALTKQAERQRMEAAEVAYRDARAKLEDLEADAAALELRAPRRGILLHGAAADAGQSRPHEVGGTLAPRQVAFTVAAPARFEVHLLLDQKQLAQVRSGAIVEVAVIGRGDDFFGTIQIDPFPGPQGHHAVVTLDAEELPELVPGLQVDVRLPAEQDQ